MVTEFVLLLSLVMVVVGLFVNTLKGTFRDAGPMLGARIEMHIETGSGFALDKQGRRPWQSPPKKPSEVDP